MSYPPIGMIGPRLIAEWGVRTQVARLRVEGVEHVPGGGAVMLVARHFHHLLDGSVLVRAIPRPVHIVVGLDWAADAGQRRWMERACRAAQYPIVLRPPTLGQQRSYSRDELVRYTRGALRDVTQLLRDGRVVLVFPEGYPTIDPTFSRKADDAAFLPFEAGFRKMIDLAERDGTTHVAVVPVGFAYERGPKWSIVARIGAPLNDRSITAAEAAVRALSEPA